MAYLKTTKLSYWLLAAVWQFFAATALFAQTYVPPGAPTPAPGTGVKLGVPATNLVLTGCASPSAFVQIFNDNAPVATTTANGQGRFTKPIRINNANAGLHNIKIYYGDVNNRTSSVVSQSINLSSQHDTYLDLLLPTTIEHEPEPVVAGNYLIFRGSTCPGSLVNVNLDNNLVLAARADSKGNWYVIANTENYYKGGHVYDALSSLKGKISPKSQKYQFNVIGHGQAPGEPPSELTPPIITEPQDLFLSGSDIITIRGTGPLNAQIELFIDGSLSGSVFTNANREWSFNMKLTNPLTTVIARSCYQTDCGEFGNTIRIRYGGDGLVCRAGFVLSDYRFHGLDANDGLDLKILGVQEPGSYEALIDWGDASVEHLTVESNKLPSIHHVYGSHGQLNGTIALSDGNGCQATAYFSALVTPASPPNWWMLATIPLAGLALYIVSQFVTAYQDKEQALPSLPDGNSRPNGWPSTRPWPKPAYGAGQKPGGKEDQDKSSKA